MTTLSINLGHSCSRVPLKTLPRDYFKVPKVPKKVDYRFKDARSPDQDYTLDLSTIAKPVDVEEELFVKIDVS